MNAGATWARLRTPGGGAALALASAAVVVFAATAQGYPVQQVNLNDGGVWVSNDQAYSTGASAGSPRGAFGRVNVPTHQLDASFFPPGLAQQSYDVDVLQQGGFVVARDMASDKAYPVDVTIPQADATQAVAVPGPDQMALNGSVVAVTDPASGKTWATPVAALPSLNLGGKPAATAGPAATMAVGASGLVVVGSAEQHKLVTVDISHGTPVVTTADLPTAMGHLQVAAVGQIPVALDTQTGALAWGVHAEHAATVDSAAGGQRAFALQQSGPAASSVLVASAGELLAVSVSDGKAATLSRDGTGKPAQPVRLAGCVYGAWAGGMGALFRGCGSATDHYDLSTMTPIGAKGVVFRENRTAIVLNDPETGAVDDVAGAPLRIDNWDSVKPVTDNKAQGDPTQGTDASSTNANHQLLAAPDHVGARPGRVTVLHVLDNDSAPDKQILAIGSVTNPDSPAIAAAITPDGQAVDVTVPAGQTPGDVHFSYTVTDSAGQSAQAQVTLSIRDVSQNEPPTPRAGVNTKAWNVGMGGIFSYPVLNDWRDFDGDPLVLSTATSDAGQVSVSADGRITYVAPDLPGPQRISYTVWDGIGDPVAGVLQLNVLGTGAPAVPATAEPDVARTFAGQQVTILPLANDIAGADPTDPSAQLTLSGEIASPQGATVTEDTTGGSVTFAADKPGTYAFTYGAAFGTATVATGRIRVDVAPPPTSVGGPQAMPDVAVLTGQSPAMVDVLANDLDPAGGVLTVTSASPADDSAALQVSVVSGRWLHVVATTPDIGGVKLVHYQVTNGTTPAVTGDVTVTQVPAPTTPSAPIARDDAAVVRAGDVVAVNVLANDSDPDGGTLSLEQGQQKQVTPDLGGAYASGSYVRYAAPASVTTPTVVTVNYLVLGSSGMSSTGHLRITVKPVDAAHDAPPQPLSLEARVPAGGTVAIPVPVYGADPDGDSVVVTGIAKAPTMGSVDSYGRSSIVYRAHPTAVGTDVFSYQVQDRFGQTGTATVRVGVVQAGGPSRPVAVDDQVTAAPGATVHVDVLSNDLIPLGDKVTLEPLDATNAVVPAGAKLDGQQVIVKAPADGAAPVVVNYGIADGTGAASLAQISVRSKAGYDIPPVARDDTVTDVPPSGGTVTVHVLDNDDDPQGTRSDLTISKVFDTTATISGSDLVIPIQTYPQTVAYEITDPAGSAAMATVYVPARIPPAKPALKTDIQPIQLAHGGTATVKIADYVTDPRGRAVVLTTKDKISGSPAASLQVDTSGDTALVLKAVGDYSGDAQVTFEVTDGSSLSDPTGAKAVLTLPVKIAAAPPSIKCPGQPIDVTAGGLPVVIDLGQLCQLTADDAQRATLKYGSTLSSVAGVTMAAGGSIGQQLTFTAAPTATPGGTGAVTVTVTGGAGPAQLTVRVVAAPPATVRDLSIGGVKAGSSGSIDVLPYVQSPFAGKAVVSVVSVTKSSGSSTAGDAAATFTGTTVTVSPTADAHGTFVFSVGVTDLANRPDRLVHGKLTVEVLGVPSTPGTPTLSSVASHTVVLAFKASQPNGSPIDGYQVTDNSGATTDCPAAPCTIGKLQNAQSYTFTVKAHNGVGWSPSSAASLPATPDQVPDAPTGLALTPGDGSVAVSWAAAHVDGSAVSEYDVQISPDPGGGPLKKVAGTTLTWSGLKNGTEYTFAVRAVNKAGAGQYGAPGKEMPFGTPVAMAAPAVSQANPASTHTQAVNVSWPAADGNGRPITGYTVTISVAKGSGGSSSSTVQEAGGKLSDTFTVNNDGSSYTYSVTATNSGGLTSAASPASAPFVAVGTPDTIGGVTAADHDGGGTTGTGYNGAIKVTFTLPAPNGATLTKVDYELNGSPAGSWSSPGAPGASVTETISGLSNGTSYTVAVRGCNEKNACATWSSASNAVTPYGPPATPTADGSANGKVISWSWGGGGGNGRPIANYEISIDGSGWTDKGASPGGEQDTYDYSQTHSIQVRIVDTAGQASGVVGKSVATGPAPTPPPSPSVSIGKGGGAQGKPGCSDPSCAWIDVSVANFAPNTKYAVTYYCDMGCTGTKNSYSSYWTTSLTTNGSGAGTIGDTQGAYYGYPGGHVYVSVGSVNSSPITW